MSTTTEILAGLPVFAGLDERSIDAIAVLARAVSAPAGEVLIREGDEGDAFFVVVRGTVHVTRGGAFVRSIVDGGFVGEIALLANGPRTATVTCATDCDLLEFGAWELGRVLERFPNVRARVEAAFARRPRGN